MSPAAWPPFGRPAIVGDRVVSTTAVDFARELADAIETQAVEEFRTKYRTAALLVFEDLGQLATRRSGKTQAQEELIHTLDALLAEDRWVVVTASAAPAELPGLLPALQSRLMAGLTIPLAPPGPAARLAVVRQLAGLRDYRSARAGGSKCWPRASAARCRTWPAPACNCRRPPMSTHDRIDLPGAATYLGERNGQRRRPAMHEIALATARHFSLRLADLRSPVRRRALVTARGVAVYLARHYAGDSLQEIGRYFGGRDHTTVMHSCRKDRRNYCKATLPFARPSNSYQKELWKT